MQCDLSLFYISCSEICFFGIIIFQAKDHGHHQTIIQMHIINFVIFVFISVNLFPNGDYIPNSN